MSCTTNTTRSKSNIPQKLGLIVNAKQTHYPIELSNSELLNHFNVINEYNNDISTNSVQLSNKLNPSINLINQQPEMIPHLTRYDILSFLFELSVVTRVIPGVYYHAVRLYDRYSSKRIVLKNQAKLVVATCLWISAKTQGGCNHIINNVCIPTGGRFYGPNPRARIPRLSELIHYSGGESVFDKSMFIQMESHILSTLGWEVSEPLINDYLLNVDENCLIQYKVYQKQLELFNKKKIEQQLNSNSSSSPQINEEEQEEDLDLQLKIQLINIKRFLIDLSTWELEFLSFNIYEIALIILKLINKYINPSNFIEFEQSSILNLPEISIDKQNYLISIFESLLIKTNKIPVSLYEIYKDQAGICDFITLIKKYNDYNLSTTNSNTATISSSSNTASINVIDGSPCGYNTPEKNSHYPTHTLSYTNSSMDFNLSSTSDISIFSHFEQPSPITPYPSNTTTNVNSTMNTNSSLNNALANLPLKSKQINKSNSSSIYSNDSLITSTTSIANKENIQPISNTNKITNNSKIPNIIKINNSNIFLSNSEDKFTLNNNSTTSLLSIPTPNLSS
ncbi:hypothetical protein TBLA_0G01710 [Henningerozyma blattae CBS 6284]|uniref:G1/S-specific cyclin n=1 Tax=Henningerozyma blattae (strain ATCC 34711 / CBS 6284 / DSM 70876 / NBRC 10599 / NRRL Y-10934 / UCD 77-7) TaxID=1071380 RepID=I2H6W3_HENB6|nr:hypothetical protein TBLA_0G01710 [Tetrapisispora blattae CBS 6284]CCH62115.1 hypothetical protein TBLA_0G01710 [Tetrapisispora blattae CBS 6284]